MLLWDHLFVVSRHAVNVHIVTEDNMEDRHATEIASALKSIAGAISGLGFSIIMGAVYIGCMIASHH